jgi:hypothetical protein
MVEANTLGALKDIVLPTSVTVWPLALGWQFLLGLLVIGFCIGIFLFYRHRRLREVRQEALRLLALYEDAYVETGDVSRTCGLISALLKRVALAMATYQGIDKATIAALHGDDWARFLSFETAPVKRLLLECPYMPSGKNYSEDIMPLFVAARQWIRKCLH